MIEDAGLQKLVKRFPTSAFMQGSLELLPKLAHEITFRAAEAVLEADGWMQTVSSYLHDEGFVLDEEEVAIEGAIAIGLSVHELARSTPDLVGWCRQRLEDAVALCLWRDEERVIAAHDPDLRREPRFLRLQAALGHPDSMGLDVSLALHGLPRPLRIPLYRLAIAGQDMASLCEESGWTEELVCERIERALRSIQSQTRSSLEVRG